jgi:predicted HTH domain antitoxin
MNLITAPHHLNSDGLFVPDRKLVWATELFRNSELTLGRAARIAEVPLVDFIAHLSQQGVPVVTGSSDSVTADVATINAWLTHET